MTFTDHKRCLFTEENATVKEKFNPYGENISIRSFNNHLKTTKSNKLSFSRKDDKRHVLEDNMHTLAHGHYTTVLK